MAVNQFGDKLGGDLPDGGRQVYEFFASSGGEVSLAFTHPSGIGKNGASIELALLDDAGNTIAALLAQGNDTLQATLPFAGKYYLQVRDADIRLNSVATYKVETQLNYSQGVTYDGGANNTTSTAILVPPGNAIRGRLENGDADYFKIQPDAGGVLALHFSHPNGQGTDGNAVDVRITDALGRLVADRSVKGDADFVTTVSAGGTYYVSIRDVFTYPGNEPGLYTLTPAFNYYRGLVYDGAVNDSPDTAIRVAPGQTAMGSLEARDSDSFRLDVSSAGKMSLNFLHPNGAGNSGPTIGLQIIDSTGKQILATQERGSDLLTVDLANGGSYYLKVADPGYLGGPPYGLYKFMFGLAGNGETIKVNGPAPFTGTSGNDVIHGSTGRDMMRYSGNAADYDIAVSPAGASVHDKRGVEGSDTLFNVERLQFQDKIVAIDVDGNAGHAFRLYQAAFDRAPDEAGFGFWISHLDRGIQIHTVAEGFIASEEFAHLYGEHPGNVEFVRALYQNVLHRAPDQGGVEYWVSLLDQNKLDRADVLVGFADSDENVAQVVGATMHGMSYIPWS